jgi:hypothetical protein
MQDKFRTFVKKRSDKKGPRSQEGMRMYSSVIYINL